MPASFNTIQGANLFVGDDPDASYHLQIDTVQLPTITHRMSEHSAGGSKVGIQVPMGAIEPLVMPFKLMGVDDAMLRRAGLGITGDLQTYTVFKEIRDTVNGGKRRLTGVARGILGSAEQDGYRKEDLSGFDYEVQGIRAWKLTIGNSVIMDIDWASDRFIVGDDDLEAESAQILGIR